MADARRRLGDIHLCRGSAVTKPEMQASILSRFKISGMNHRPPTLIRILLACAFACGALICWPVVPSVGQADPAIEMLARINAVRVAQELPPYALSDKLSAAAQAHSKDMASKSRVDRNGSDDSTPKSRILNAGYGQWTIGPVIDEAIYGGTGGAQGAFDWWMGTDADKRRILSTRFREVGIGAATAPNGWTYWTLDLGAEPNVLPAFVNNGVSSVDTTAITLTLTTENAVPSGEGASTLGQPVQVRVASDESFTGTDWQPWAAQVPFRLLAQAQQKIYILYRDTEGRTASFWVAVTLTNVPPATFTPSPTWTPPPSITPLPTNTRKPTETAPPTRAPLPTVGGGETATLVPLPSATFVPIGTPPTATPSSLPGTSVALPRSTPRPRTTPTAVAIGLYATPPPNLPQAVCVLQAVALVLAALIVLSHSLHRLPAAPAPTQASTTAKDSSQS